MGPPLAVPTSPTHVTEWVGDNRGRSPPIESESETVALDLETLYSKYAKRIREYCQWHLNGNAEDAEDACHETILRAYQALRHSRPVALWPWLMTIAGHICVGIIRQHSKLSHYDEMSEEETEEQADDSEQVLALREEIVTKALARLAPRYRECLLLHSYEGWSCDDIARLDGITPVAAASVLLRARRALKAEVRRVARAMGEWPLPTP